ncbi:MAG: ATP-binding protein [Actinobacteria bacterium]|nr:ATP-binding protein [Actinomycetota bacterium]
MRSLRARIVALVAVGVAVSAVAVTLLVAHRDWRLADATLLDVVMDETDRLDRAVAQQFDDGDEATIEDPVDGDAVAIFDVDGEIADTVGDLSTRDVEAIADEFEIDTLSEFDIVSDDVEIDGTVWAVGVTGCIEPAACAAIVVARERSSFGAHVADRLAWILGIVLVSTLLAAFASRWVVGRSLRPVDRMRREVDEITTDDLSRRVAVPATGDEVEALGSSFNRTIDRLERGVDAQRRFASDAAHELRSPLAGMRAVLEVGQRHPERATESMATAIAQIDRASRLIDDLLVLARRDGDRTPLERKAVDLDDLVVEMVREATARYPEISFDRRGVTPVQALVVGPAIARVVQNLLDNAARHAHGRVRVRLGAAMGRPGAELGWELSVDDDGPGVPAVDRERVFERFARLDESRSRHTGGTGLGLAIVRDLVTEHGGTVHVADSDLGGASFVVRVLPAV